MHEKNCSAFRVHNENNEVITGRNYDMPHFDKKGNLTGLNFILRMKPKGKYQSINGVDACWLSLLGLPYYAGSIEKNSKLPLAFLPYLCMDGMNEKGLTVSILALDLKDGEKCVNQNEKGKKKLNVTMLLRDLLDNCANIEQAIEYTNSINMVNTNGYDYHLFVSDCSNKSIAIEWRYNQTIISETDALTNFYISADDGVVEEKIEFDCEYHYGYGHGYDRFNKLIERLKSKRISGYDALMNEKETMELLSNVAQNYNGENTSFTQYSVVYNSTNLTCQFCVQQDYQHKFLYEIKV